MRRVNPWLLFAASFLFVCWIGTVAAETIPATQVENIVSTEQYKYGHSNCWLETHYYPTAAAAGAALEAACKAYNPAYYKSCTNYAGTYYYPPGGGVGYTRLNNINCSGGAVDLNGNKTAGCVAGTTWTGTACVTYSYSCPANQGWTLSGTSCTRTDCAAGQARDANGACIYTCNKTAGAVQADGFFDIGTSPTNSPLTNPCIDHCSTAFNGTSPAVSAVVGGVTHYYAQGSYEVLNGDAACQTNTPNLDVITQAPQNDQTCGANQVGGYVNGVFTCVDNSTGTPTPQPPPVSSSTTSTTTVTNPDNSTTTTTTTTNPDGSKSTTTTTTPPPGSTDPVTTSKTTTGGGAALGGSSEATAKDSLQELKDIKDELKKSDCEKNPNGFGCGSTAITGEDSTIPSSVINVAAITPVSLGGAGSCPADTTVDYLGQPVNISWAIPCQFANGIKPVLLAVAWLAAGLILIGAFKQG